MCIKIDAPSENFPPKCRGPAAFSSPAQQHKSYQLLIRLNLLEINAVLLSHYAKVQKYQQDKIRLQYFDMWCIKTLWRKNQNPARVSFLGLTLLGTAIQALSTKTGEMAMPC